MGEHPSSPIHRRFREPNAWEGVERERYKEDASFRDVTRQVLFDGEHGQCSQLRYFEIGPGGHTTLERHGHAHSVVVVRGAGRVLVDPHVVDVRAFDLISVPPMTWHQLRADDDQPLGFLCLVDRERDRPENPGVADLERLHRDPEIAAFIRV